MPEIVVVCENRDDWQLAALLADRVLKEKGPSWLDEDSLDLYRRWCGFPISDPEIKFIRWPELKKLPKPAKSLGYRNLGWDAEACRKAIIATESESRGHQVVALLLVRDLDSEPKRRQVLEAVRTESNAAFRILLATPNPEMEAWIFHGFEALGRDEERRLSQLRKKLSFDPVSQAHLFPARAENQGPEERKIKKALDSLTGEDPARRKSCLANAPLQILLERGRLSYLADYLVELEEQLLPLLTGELTVSRKRRKTKG
jgi:hypothetical protein